MTFAAATTATPEGNGRYSTAIHDGWDIRGNANGGYLLAVAARAMVAHSGRPDPVTLTAHYLRPGKPGPASVDCTTVKAGKRFTTVSATLAAEAGPVLQLLGTFGDLSADDAAGAEVLRVAGEPPELPPVAECNARDESGTPGFAPAFHDKVDLRLHPEDAGFAFGKPSGEAQMRGWFRLHGDEPIDTVALLMGTDSFPPTIFNARLPVGWTPTVELTAHVRARPAPGWLRARFTSRFVTGGFLEEDGELWDAEGRLVAQSRQLALVPRVQKG